MMDKDWQQVCVDCVNVNLRISCVLSMTMSTSPSLSHVVLIPTSLFYSALAPCRVPVWPSGPRMLWAVAVVGCVRVSTDIRQCQATHSGSCSVVLHFLFKGKVLPLLSCFSYHFTRLTDCLQSWQLSFFVDHFQEERICPSHQSFPRSPRGAGTHFARFLLYPCHPHWCLSKSFE